MPVEGIYTGDSTISYIRVTRHYLEVGVERDAFDAVLQELSQQGYPVNIGDVVARLAERGIVVTVDEVQDYLRTYEGQQSLQWEGDQGVMHTTGTGRSSLLPWWTPEHDGE